jgi:hypothetical protein
MATAATAHPGDGRASGEQRGQRHALKAVLSHFYTRAAVVLAVWGVKRLLLGRERRRAAPPAAPRAAPAIQTCTIIEGRAYQPRNPPWVVQWLAYDPAAASPQQPACPLLRQWLQGGGPQEAAALVQGGRARELFSLDSAACYLNHGSYGATLRLAARVAQWYREQLDSQPVLFMETTNMQHLVDAVYQVGCVGAGGWVCVWGRWWGVRRRGS